MNKLQYIVLSPDCTVRNEQGCSYLVTISRAANNSSLGFDTLPIPPFMGYIFSNIGKFPIPEAFEKIASELGTSAKAIENFITQLVETTESRKFTLNDSYDVVFPANLLLKSDIPDLREFKIAENFNPTGEFIMRRPQMPFSVNLMTTTACSTDCIYCYADRSITNLLTTEEILTLLDYMHREGVVNVTLTGGDLMMRSDWPILMKRIIEYGYNHFVSTKTPLNRQDIKYLVDLGFTEIQFSLDSVDPEVSEKMVKGGKDYLEKVDQMLSLCTEFGINVQIRTVITRLNGSEESMNRLYDFLCNHDCVKSWDMTPAFFSGYKKDLYKSIEANNEDLKRAYSLAHKKLKFPVSTAKISEEGYKLKTCETTGDFVCRNQVCLANVTAISILANGKCSICEMIYQNPDYILGDIRKQSLKEIWNSPKALRFYSPEQKDFPKDTPCHSCGDFQKCRKEYGKRVCFSDICKTGLRPVDPDPRCPMSIDMDYIL